MGSIMGIWQLTYIAFAVPGGILLDRVGSRYALTLGVLFIALSALLRGIAEDYMSMLLAVMLFGVGGPIVSAGAPKMITRWFHGQSRGLAMGIYMTGPAIGGIVSLTLTHSFLLPILGSWRNLMTLNAIIAFTIATGWYLIATNNRMRASEILSQADPSPQLPAIKGLIQQPAVRIILFMSIGVFLVNHGLNNWLPEILKNTGMTLIEAGYWAAIPTVIGILGSLTIPRLATPGRRFPILLALTALAALATLLLQFSEAPLQFSGLLLQGIARSSMMTVLILTLVELPGIGEKNAGLASGLFFSAAEVGGVLGPVTLGFFYDATGNFTLALAALTLVCLILLIATAHLKKISEQNPNQSKSIIP
jgi:MFS transporter, CP family, cyanate transporter